MNAADISLTPSELAYAAWVGVSRNVEALRDQRQQTYGSTGDNAWTLHIEGAAGEMAAAKALDLFWNAPIGTYRRGGDIGAVQVRTRSQHSYELIVRPDDRPDDVFVLVTGRAPRYRVPGWITGREAMQPEWLHEHGDRPAAYFVPHAALHPLSTMTHDRAAA